MDQDEIFFRQHPDRYTRIRLPEKQLFKDSARAVRYLDESEIQFRHLGGHDPKRRRIIVFRTGPDDPVQPNTIIKLPMLLFADETIEDTDLVLLPFIYELMKDAAK